MKKVILTVIIAFFVMISYSQSQLNNGNTTTDQSQENTAFTYRLYPTQNMWNFIKLNSRNGKMWQIQYTVEGSNRFESDLSLLPLIEESKEVDNRFTLYPTQNTWNFILLDQIDGRTWQVQWSLDLENRGIMEIK